MDKYAPSNNVHPSLKAPARVSGSPRLGLAVLALSLLAALPTSHASEIQGVASVVDGDTIEVHGQRIRFWGIDAPESAQTCQRKANGQVWRCGAAAANALAERIGRQPVRCEDNGERSYDRVIAVCYQGGTNLNSWLVSQGWALDSVKYSRGAYAAEQQQAQDGQRNIWSSHFEAPWMWRRR